MSSSTRNSIDKSVFTVLINAIIPSMLESVNGVAVWKNYEARSIPGSTRIPIQEIRNIFHSTSDLLGLDVGSGAGRSTEILRKELGCRVVAVDVSMRGLLATDSTSLRIVGDAQLLPFENEVFDFVNLAGLMANLTHKEPERAKAMRYQVAREVYRCLKPEGCAVVSDFAATGELSGLKHNYRGHALITGEYGTSVGFSPPCPTDFEAMTDDEILEYAGTHTIDRFTHHYSASELVEIFHQAGFKIPKYSIELGKSSSGRERDAIVLTAVKA